MPVLPTFDPLPDVPVCVAFSGGMDSTALLHALAGNNAVQAHGLRALHVHHGLSADADAWASHCAGVCASWNVPFDAARVQVDLSAGLGIEGAARSARHAAFAHALRPGEYLALAHHLDDQAETFLLRALRGSGVDGLAAMRTVRPFGAGHLWRPWLAVPRDAIAAYARAQELCWIDDPANDETRFDRNFLRHRIIPLLRERWPHAAAVLSRSASLAGAAAAALSVQDRIALDALSAGDRARLDVTGLLALTKEQRARLLRLWVADLGLPPLPSRGVESFEDDLLHARLDGAAAFAWEQACIRRWRHGLYAGRADGPPPIYPASWDGIPPLRSDQGDELCLEGSNCLSEPVLVGLRIGGERIRLPGREHRHALKNVLQDLGIPPWIRPRLPLLYAADGELLAAGPVTGDRLQKLFAQHGTRLCWQERSNLPSRAID